MTIEIRPAEAADWPLIWAMLEPAVRAGETLALPAAMQAWLRRAKRGV